MADEPAVLIEKHDSVAVITALFGAPDIKAAARQFSAIFSR